MNKVLINLAAAIGSFPVECEDESYYKTAIVPSKTHIKEILELIIKDGCVPFADDEVCEEDFEMNCVANSEAQLIVDEIMEYDDVDNEEYFAGYVEYSADINFDIEIECEEKIADIFRYYCKNRCPAQFSVFYGYEGSILHITLKSIERVK